MRLNSSVFVLAALLVGAAGCTRNLELPAPPGAGSIQGSVVYAEPGQSTLRPATGATIELLGSSVATIAQGDDAFFTLTPIAVETGALLIRLDLNNDGVADRQKLIRLEEIHAGPGKNVALGQIVLGINGVVQGTVLRQDLGNATTGHAGTTVFIPEGPFTTYSGDNGGFSLDKLPEGQVTLAFFRNGYASNTVSITLRAGEVFRLSPVMLEPLPNSPATSKVVGNVVLDGQTSAAGVTVTIDDRSATATSDSDGNFTFDTVTRGIHSFGFQKDGFGTAVLKNMLIDGEVVVLRGVTLTTGTSVQPNLDAGTPPPPDGGSSPPDAGEIDAGMNTMLEDGGMLPTAVIDPPPPYVLPNSNFQLVAQNSIGEGPLSYFWTVDGGTVNIANNGTPLAATPNLFAPSSPTLLSFGLQVKDVHGRLSHPVGVLLPVSVRPTAVITAGNPTTVYAGQAVIYDATASNDPNGSGIAHYEWTVNPMGSVTTTPLSGGKQLQVTAPSSVATAVLVNVSLTVTNGLGAVSNPVSTQFTLSTVAAPTWGVDAGVPQTVGDEDVVTLKGGASAPGFMGASFNFTWSPTREPANGVADWVLTNPTSPTTTFIAPKVVGANRLINFTLTADAMPPLMPAQKSAITWVTVQDRKAPVVTATSISSNGLNSTTGAWVEFDEPLKPSSINGIYVALAPGATGVAPYLSNRFLEGNRVTLVFRRLAEPGTGCAIYIGGVQDTAPTANTVMAAQYQFLPEQRWSPAYESAASMTAEPRPGVVAVSDGTAGSYQVHVTARNNTTPIAYGPVNTTSCLTAPCTLPVDTAQPSGTLGATVPSGATATVMNGTPIGVFQIADFAGSPAMAFSRVFNMWTALPPAPGYIISDDVDLSTVYVDSGGLKIAAFNPAAPSWNTAAATVLSNNTTDFSWDASSFPIVAADAVSGVTDTYVIARTSKSGEVRVFQKSRANGTWTSVGNLGTGGTTNKVLDVRIMTGKDYPTAAWAALLRQDGSVNVTLFGAVNNGWTPIASGATAIDVAYEPSFIWLAAAVNGQIELRSQQLGTGQWLMQAGPRGGNNYSLNNDTSCTADKPHMALLKDRIYVTWQEKCGAGPWKVYLRALQ
ncbi:MAG: hypothetical protein K1X64_22405 [Myxococcaceae bacterium]|nr:hypothetical protein [Myxococcaceae bacterium]